MSAAESGGEVGLRDSINFENGGLLPAGWHPDRFAKLLLRKQDALLSCNDPSPTSVTHSPGTIAAFHEPNQVEECVKEHMAALIDDLQQILQHVTDELATEVSREQQHLMLMQDQVDKLSTMLLREVADSGKRAEQEKTQRCCMQRATREAMEALTGKVEQQAAELEKLHSRLQRLETPLIIRVIKGIWRLLFGCGGGRRNAVAAGSSAGNDTKSRGVATLSNVPNMVDEKVAFMTAEDRAAALE